MKPDQNSAMKTGFDDAIALIEHLEMPYLEALAQRLQKHISERRITERAAATEQIRKIAASVGMSVEELITPLKTPLKNSQISGAKSKRPAQFADPRDPINNTWSGSGRAPLWFRELELELNAQGKTREELRIKDADAK